MFNISGSRLEDLPEIPYRSESLSMEKLKEYAKQLAHTQETGSVTPKFLRSLLNRLRYNEKILLNIHQEFMEALKTDRTILPSSTEWLLENYYVVTEQMRLIKSGLSKRFYNQLPKLKNGPYRGYPRIYSIALELLLHRDSQIDMDVLVEFMRSYQTISPLTIAELWATPIMLRLVLIENLRRVMEQTLVTQRRRQKADKLLKIILSATKQSQHQVTALMGKVLQENEELEPAFLIRLLRGLKDQDPDITGVIRQIELYMSEENINLTEIVQTENQHQATNRITTGNIITSMRLLTSLEWADFFEKTSLVEKILNGDPAGIYTQMDFASRDYYRHQVEALSKYSRFNELEVARRAVSLARETPEEADVKLKHVGYYLRSGGLNILQENIQYQPNFKVVFRRVLATHPAPFYVGVISGLTVLFTVLLQNLGLAGNFSMETRLLTELVLLIPLSIPVIGIINWLVIRFFPPSPPVKLEITGDINPNCRTIVIVPCLVSKPEDVDILTENLEKRYLANWEKNLHFALLSDFTDALQEEMPYDQELVDKLVLNIQQLNAKYASDNNHTFYLFHRKRVFNKPEGVWMGWERKRGKLEEFNRLVRGDKNTSFKWIEGDISLLSQMKYAITLDADTQLPAGAAKKLIGAISHPLNKPVIDPVKNIVVDGYGIIQPRVDISAPSAAKSLFANIFTGDTGLDPYSMVVSNVYQDLFGSGIYVGKAIYDIDVMEKVVGNRFPENKLLSHDLLEGGYVRVGLASDIELLEDFPAGYNGDSRRQHRWIRGDWQIIDWLLPLVPNFSGKWESNSLSFSERWKIFDNLRRSLVPLSIVTALIAAWLFLPGNIWYWQSIVLAAWIFPMGQIFVSRLGEHLVGESWGSYLMSTLQEIARLVQLAFVQLILIAHEAIRNTDAILRAVARMFVTRKRRLEWITYAEGETRQMANFSDYLKNMQVDIILELLLLAILIIFKHPVPSGAVVIITAWLSAPLVTYKISRPRVTPKDTLDAKSDNELRQVARKIWRFYDDLANEENHFLPPDNVQIEPRLVITNRTSTTNIAFLLLSTIAAKDFGFITCTEMITHLTKTVDTLSKLSRFHGHFFNWYDTRTLLPLHPEYISTVDSANLIAGLITVKQVCQQALHENESPMPKLHQGLHDVMRILAETGVILPETENLDQLKIELTKHMSKNDTQSRYWATQALNQCERIEETEKSSDLSSETISSASRIASLVEGWIRDTDFMFLFDQTRKVFVTGFSMLNNRPDESFYDLMASEARLASLIAIGLGKIPLQHWFRLGRPLTRIKGQVALLSWGGTMFEYLMPTLFTKDYANTLLSQTNQLIIDHQIEYGSRRKLPWGISESGFYAFDLQYNYQYRLFGVPDLGLRVELSDNSVVSPYATFLSLPFRPAHAWQNLQKLKELGGAGEYGYFEALDFTSSRVPKGQKFIVVRSFMAHHQGMSLVALDNYFHNFAMQERFHSNGYIMAIETLLQEKIPRHAPVVETSEDKKLPIRELFEEAGGSLRPFATANTTIPRAQILSNSDYTTVITNSGSGYSTYKKSDVTRWRLDPTLDNWGQYIVISHPEKKLIWSATHQPFSESPDNYRVSFMPNRAEFRRRDGKIETKTEIIVSPENAVEVRRVTLTNLSDEPQKLELTTYSEIVLSGHGDDLIHPAFNKLFIETDYDKKRKALFFRRRPRDETQKPIWAFHTLYPVSGLLKVTGHETDRSKFLGRGHTLDTALAWKNPLSNTTGAVLDPIMCLRGEFVVDPKEQTVITSITGVAASREEAIALLDKFCDKRETERSFDSSEIHEQIEQRHLGISPNEATLFQRLGSRIIYPDPVLQADNETKTANYRSQTGLFPYGISGDFPIILLKIGRKEGLGVVREMLAAHEYLRMKNLTVDLVIVCEEPALYASPIVEQIQSLIETSLSNPWLNKPGGIFLRNGYQIPPEDKMLINSVARVIINADWGSLSDHLDLTVKTVFEPHQMSKVNAWPPEIHKPKWQPTDNKDLKYFNGYGGFDDINSEYNVIIKNGKFPPAPWSNILSNKDYGCLVTELGLGATWSINSQTHRLTPWSNDAVSPKVGEALYLYDHPKTCLWAATPLGAGCNSDFLVRHGLGYTVYETEYQGIKHETSVFVPSEDRLKVVTLKLKNTTSAVRNISVVYYLEWVLGSVREKSQSHIITEWDKPNQVILARNHFDENFKNQVAYVTASEKITEFTCDRTEFLGRNGSRHFPAALVDKNSKLSGKTGSNLDPCSAICVQVNLNPKEEKELIFLLGDTDDPAIIPAMKAKYFNSQTTKSELEKVKNFWLATTGSIQINTPDPGINLLSNRWLLYQVLSCRLWSRSSFYQSGGGYGFRDQLQDVMALVYSRPEITRQHLLLAAVHQFAEGDVMHWWQSPDNIGLRTKISDDYLWLPYAVEQYVRTTGDTGILDEEISFAVLPVLQAQEKEYYGKADRTPDRFTLYDHCLRALEKSWSLGQHDLPLIGSGDWNDGLNSVGDEGRGESVWLGWFMIVNYRSFATICESKQDLDTSKKLLSRADKLLKSIEENGWDGEWYRRAYFDDGTILGSKDNKECFIDSISQSWAAMSRAANPHRVSLALQSTERYLVKQNEKMILLLTGPFNHSMPFPGYIQGYIPGVRENGGQYTHAAIWTVIATALTGNGDRAMELFKLINPINHTDTSEGVEQYKLEPYVIAADVYSHPEHVGRGGWSWYTGSAAWMYRTAIEYLLGLQLSGSYFTIDPCIPKDWEKYEMKINWQEVSYQINVENPHRANTGVIRIELDGKEVENKQIPVLSDQKLHQVKVVLGSQP
jgi:cyclic beta-1,2-glucan synthetase